MCVWWLERRGWHLSARTRVSDDVSGAAFATYSGFMYVNIYRRVLYLIARWGALLGPGGRLAASNPAASANITFPFCYPGEAEAASFRSSQLRTPARCKGGEGFCRSLDGMRLW